MKVHLSGSLARFADHNRDLQIEGGTVREVLEELCEDYPEFGDILYDREGEFRNHHRLYLNGDPVDGALDDAVGQEDRLDIMTAIAGG